MVETKNHFLLTEGGYDGVALQAVLKGMLGAHSNEHNNHTITKKHFWEQIQLLAHANKHGKKLHATGGSHVCPDNFSRHRHFAVVIIYIKFL